MYMYLDSDDFFNADKELLGIYTGSALAGKRIRVVSFRLSSSGYLNDFDDGSSLIWGRDLSGNVKADVILSNQRHARYRRCHKCPD